MPTSSQNPGAGRTRDWIFRRLAGALVDTERVSAELDAYRAENLREAIEAARDEYLTDDTGTPEDEAYNRGVSDAVAAIGALLEGGAR